MAPVLCLRKPSGQISKRILYLLHYLTPCIFRHSGNWKCKLASKSKTKILIYGKSQKKYKLYFKSCTMFWELISLWLGLYTVDTICTIWKWIPPHACKSFCLKQDSFPNEASCFKHMNVMMSWDKKRTLWIVFNT